MTTQSECQKGTNSLQLKGVMILMVKNYHIGNKSVECNRNNGAINRVDFVTGCNRIICGKQTA
jgi:hypothetical protein